MSLYNALFGVNQLAPFILLALGTTSDKVPRFRDAYINEDGEMIIYTRTGGGNRDYYDSPETYAATRDTSDADNDYKGPFNEDLRALPGFLGDVDDDFDSTYASFRYSIPPSFKKVLDTLNLPPTKEPKSRWQALLADLAKGTDAQTPEGKRALEVGQKIFASINEQLSAREATANAEKKP
jgi:hypothetical protein